MVEHLRARLDQVSPTFCLAKWFQVSVHLEPGETQSCCHTERHAVPTGELEKNPSVLHNTPLKKEQRRAMRAGQKTPECEFCWKVEAAPGDHLSERHFRSAQPWAEPFLKEAAASAWDADVNPRFLEVSFGTVCNFKCSYCGPDLSSAIRQEVAQFGRYLDHKVAVPVINLGDSAKYREAFWAWLPQIYSSLLVLKVTGGEPLLNADTFRLFEFVTTRQSPELELTINSNLCVPERAFDRAISQWKQISSKGAVKEVRLCASLDTWGKAAEYLRHGLNLKQFTRNLERFAQDVPGSRITVMCTFNALCLPNFREFLDQILRWKEIFGSHHGRDRLSLSITSLEAPSWMCLQVLSESGRRKVSELLSFMREARSPSSRAHFLEYEIEHLRRIHNTLVASPWSEAVMQEQRASFYRYFHEYDRRKGTHFVSSFPSYVDFWESCQKADWASSVPEPKLSCSLPVTQAAEPNSVPTT